MIPKEYIDYKHDKNIAKNIHRLFDIICQEEKVNNLFDELNGYWHEEYGVAEEVVLAYESKGFKCFDRNELTAIFKYNFLGCFGYHLTDEFNSSFFENVISKYFENKIDK